MSDSAARTKPTISRKEWGLLLLLAAVHFTNILDFVIIMPIAPWAKERFQIDSEQFGHIVAAYGFASFVGSIFAAKYLDRFARKAVLLATYMGFTIGTLFCGLAPTYETLVAARALTGLFGGVMGAAVFAIVGDVFADFRRGTAMGVIMASFAVASIFGLPIGLLLIEYFGMGAPFLALAGVSALIWLGNFRVLPPLHAHADHPPTSLWRLAVEPNHLIAFTFTTALVLGSFLVVPFLADSMVANSGQERESMKYLYPVAGGCTLISTVWLGRLSDRFGKRLVFRIAGVATIVMTLVLTSLPVVALWVAIAAATAFMVSSSGRMVAAQAMITASAAPAVRGGFLSLNSAVQSAGMGLASLVAGALIGQTDDGKLPGYPLVGLIAAGSTLLSLVLAGFLRSAEIAATTVVVEAHRSDSASAEVPAH
jgi:predicted MFS family arabinose efflux permease